MKCPRCGFTGSDEAAACRTCGQDLTETRRGLGLGEPARVPRATTPLVDGPVDPSLIDDAPPPAAPVDAASILDLGDRAEGDTFDGPEPGETDLGEMLARTDPVDPAEIPTEPIPSAAGDAFAAPEPEPVIDLGEPVDPEEATAPARQGAPGMSTGSIGLAAAARSRTGETADWVEDGWEDLESDLGARVNPRAMPKGGFWLRVVASTADSLFIQIVATVVLFMVAGASGVAAVMTAHLPAQGANPVETAREIEAALQPFLMGPLGWTLLALLVLGSLYRPVCHWRWGMTVGKKLVGLRVVTTEGERLGFGRACWRDMAYLISSIPLGLGLLWVAWDPQKQGWHDKLARTYVLKENA